MAFMMKYRKSVRTCELKKTEDQEYINILRDTYGGVRNITKIS